MWYFVAQFGNCISTLKGVYGPLELLEGIQNMVKLFCGIEEKVWELWEFSMEGNWLFWIKFIGGDGGKKGNPKRPSWPKPYPPIGE